jgi:peptidoglycan/LPS O-acetylase OafA/YrhL
MPHSKLSVRQKGMNMKNENRNWTTPTYISAFLIGVILFWSIGKGWLDVESASIFLAGLIGVAVSVLTFAAWNIYHDSHHKEN